MEPDAVVRTFLEQLGAGQEAVAHLDPDVVWRNTGMPAIRGQRVHQMLLDMQKRGIGFDVRFHHVAVSGDTVLTDRTDVISYGRWSTEFPVRGTFEVRDGRITLWDDAFSWLALAGSGFLGLGRLLTSR